MRTYDILNAGPSNRFMANGRIVSNSSGIVQVQNLVKATKEVEKKYDLAMKLLKAGDYDSIKKEFSSPIDVACAALRPLFRAPSGKTFIVADLASIEARGSAWVAGCDSLMSLFRDNKDAYVYFACLMDPSLDYDEAYKRFKAGDKKFRNDAKPPMLGCCYGLTPGEIAEDEDGNTVKTGLLGYASAMGIELPLEYAVKAVEVYRNSFPEVVNFWWDLHRAFVEVTENGGSYQIGPLTLEKKGRVLAILLPSGRSLHYINPQVTWTDAISKRGRPYKRSEITIEGIDQKTHQWMRIQTRGAKLFENVVQALCRDILAYGMIEAKKMGFEIVLTCHDEIVAEVPEDGNLGVDQLVQAMIKPLSWCPGFLIGAEGYATDYYRKE